MIKILVTGAFCVLNKGDAALRLGGLRSLREIVPETEFTIMTLFPETDSKIYHDGRVIRAIDSPFKAMGTIIRCITWKMLHDYLKIRNRFADKILDTDEIQEYVKSDIILDISGDSFSEVDGLQGATYHFLHIWLGVVLNKKIVIYAQSVGPFTYSKLLAKYLLNNVDLITLRGQASYDYLQKIGIDKTPIHLTADLAFLMPSAPKERIDEILYDIEKIKGNSFIGLSTSNWISKYYGSYEKFVYLMANIVDYMTEELDTTVIFIPHVTGPKDEFDDRIIGEDIYNIIKHKDKVVLIRNDYTPQEMKGIISRCSLFIGARMHACIGALSTGVPTINISYHHKSNDIMTMFGLKKNVLRAQDLDFENLKKTIDETWLSKQEIKLRLASKIGYIEKQATSNALILRDLLKDKKIIS